MNANIKQLIMLIEIMNTSHHGFNNQLGFHHFYNAIF
jgi:hypothetical protein